MTTGLGYSGQGVSKANCGSGNLRAPLPAPNSLPQEPDNQNAARNRSGGRLRNDIRGRCDRHTKIIIAKYISQRISVLIQLLNKLSCPSSRTQWHSFDVRSEVQEKGGYPRPSPHGVRQVITDVCLGAVLVEIHQGRGYR